MNPNILINKQIYIEPKMIIIKLDNEIALALESEPPTGPNEVYNSLLYYSNDPLNIA